MLDSSYLSVFFPSSSRHTVGQAGTPVSDSDSFLGDMQSDARASPAMSRRQLVGSGEITNGFIRMEQEYAASPDITPNGSLRRRQSRVLAGEDELMSFLRKSTGPGDGSGHVSRDRKAAYGSLGRWHNFLVIPLLLLTPPCLSRHLLPRSLLGTSCTLG